MGESKRKKRLTQQVLEAFPNCIYCGGTTQATTADHLPPRAMFDNRHRPRGLEFPACAACNDGGRIDELIAAMLSRFLPDGDTIEKKAEMKKLMKSVFSRVPGLHEEMRPSDRQNEIISALGVRVPQGAGALNCRGPILNKAMSRFAAKVGFALHFEQTKKPIPPAGGVCVWWLTNYSALNGEVPGTLLRMLGEPSTLQQGRWSVSEQFEYASRPTDTGAMSAHFAAFRQSFAICAFAATNRDQITPPADVTHVHLFSPGWLTAV